MKLVLIRHGQSEYNVENRFTGWLDPKLTEKGRNEAMAAGKALKELGILLDEVHTSVLTRAIQSCHLVLEELDQLYLPVHKTWRLNERHYGAFQGLSKTETVKKYGEEQVHIWRRSYDVRPPRASVNTALDRRYALLDSRQFLAGESLKDNLKRTFPYFEDQIAPQLKAGLNVLVVAHGNSLRSLIKPIEGISDEDIMGVEVETGEPIIYDLDDQLNVVKKTILHKK